MKTKYFLFIGMIISFLLSACSSKDSGMTHFAYQETENGKWGFMSTEGEIVVPPTFHGMPTPVTDDMFFVPKEDGTYELHNINEPEKVINANYTGITSFSEGKAFVIQGTENILCINKTGDILYELPSDIIMASTFSNGRVIIAKNDNEIAAIKYGYIDKKGEMIIPCDYLSATGFSNNFAVVAKANTDSICIINKNGAIIDKINDDVKDETFNTIIGNFQVWTKIKSDAIPYVSNGNFGLKKIEGDIFLKADHRYKLITSLCNGYFVFQTNNGYGVMKETGEEITSDKYSFIGGCNMNGCFAASISKNGDFDKWGIYSIDGTTLCTPIYDLIFPIVNSSYFIAINDGKFFFITKEGKVLYRFYNVNFSPIFNINKQE